MKSFIKDIIIGVLIVSILILVFTRKKSEPQIITIPNIEDEIKEIQVEPISNIDSAIQSLGW
jgi:hypothetical protein